MTSTATSGSQPIDIRPLIHPRERLLFWVNLGLAAAVLSLVVAFVPDLLLYLAAFAVLSFLVTAYSLAQIRGNGVRVSERQFPAIHSVAVELEARLGLAKRPAIYVLQSNGVLNAFAAKFVRRDIVVLNSDLLELVADRADDEIAFALAHELAHVKRRHVLWRLLLAPAAVEPFTWQAYSRACEFTCDRIAAAMCPSGAPGGLLVLAAGKRLYRQVDPAIYARQLETERGFWVWLVEKLASHPRLPGRVAALAAAGA